MAATGVHLGRRSEPVEPESEDLLALAATAARSHADPATGSRTTKATPVTLIRDRRDRCPGALRPWPASDGMLVRLRLIGGRLSAKTLLALLEVAERFGDGRVHVTNRANLQVRAFPGADGRLAAEALAALEATGLVPTRTHELVRNVMVSPQTGLAGGRADLRPVAAQLDEHLCGNPRLAELPGRFLFVLDDGRGDLLDRSCDLGLVALTEQVGQLRVGECWGEEVPLTSAATRLASLADRFLAVRGVGATARWHVAELATPLTRPAEPDPRLPAPTPPLPFGDVPGGRHVAWPSPGLERSAAAALTGGGVKELVVTPWRGVLIPEEEGQHD
jgi:precorrin-3B synthase